MKRKQGSLVYTNIGMKARQHKRLKHLAVEESKDMASLVREAIDMYLVEKTKGKLPDISEDFVCSKMGRSAVVTKPDRPYDPKDWSQIDRDLYGE